MAPRESCTCKPHGCLADGRLWALEEAHTLLQKPQGFPSLLLQLSEEVPSSAKPQKQQQDHQMLCPHPPGQVRRRGLTRALRMVHTSFSAKTGLSLDQPRMVALWQRACRQFWETEAWWVELWEQGWQGTAAHNPGGPRVQRRVGTSRQFGDAYTPFSHE